MCYKDFRSQINWVTCVGTKMEPCHLRNQIFENQFWFYHSCQSLASQFSLLILARDIISPLPFFRSCTDGQSCWNKAISGWKGKVNKTAWWEGCRWLLKVLQQNENQFILEQPIESWLNWGALIVLTLLNPFSFRDKCNFKKGCLKWKVRSSIVRKCPYKTFWIFMWSISAFLSDT